MENKNKFRLPTKEEFEKLIKCPHAWNAKKQAMEFFPDNGSTLVFPAKGYREVCRETTEVGYVGHYWSSTVHKYRNEAYYVYALEFAEELLCSKDCCRIVSMCRGGFRSVRLVSDTPFSGAIEIGGVYWKTENEENRYSDYYTYDKAMEKFDGYVENKTYIEIDA